MRPAVFISFAGPDHESARRLKRDLKVRGVSAFFAPEDLPAGASFPAVLSDALTEADYFVLLTSASSLDRPWVTIEWTAALAREVHERRLFLFLLRLDQACPPTLLGARNYLDGFADWTGSVDRLAETWRMDYTRRAAGTPVLPAPGLGETPPEATLGLYVVNQAFSVQHYLRVAPTLAGWQLHAQIRGLLGLKDQVDAFNGQVGIRLSYVVSHAGRPVDADGVPIAERGMRDGDSLDLRVTVEPFMPGNAGSPVVFRAVADLPVPVLEKLIHQAFGHLLPHDRNERDGRGAG